MISLNITSNNVTNPYYSLYTIERTTREKAQDTTTPRISTPNVTKSVTTMLQNVTVKVHTPPAIPNYLQRGVIVQRCQNFIKIEFQDEEAA